MVMLISCSFTAMPDKQTNKKKSFHFTVKKNRKIPFCFVFLLFLRVGLVMQRHYITTRCSYDCVVLHGLFLPFERKEKSVLICRLVYCISQIKFFITWTEVSIFFVAVGRLLFRTLIVCVFFFYVICLYRSLYFLYFSIYINCYF